MRNRFYSNATALLVTIVMLLGCGTAQHLPQTTTQVVTLVKDSLIVRTDTLVIPVPVESHSSVAYQHSRLETSVAWSEAEVDTLGLLHHQIENKPTALKKEVVYLDRVKTEYRDSLVVKEVPVEVEVPVRYVPKFYKFTLVWFVLSILAIGGIAYLKFLKP